MTDQKSTGLSVIVCVFLCIVVIIIIAVASSGNSDKNDSQSTFDGGMGDFLEVINPTLAPTELPTTPAPNAPTEQPTNPTAEPTGPTADPTEEPTNPTTMPTEQPTNPTAQPTKQPTNATAVPTKEPTSPTVEPTKEPTNPTAAPTEEPTSPTADPTVQPTKPTAEPTVEPTSPTMEPSNEPTQIPTDIPSELPTSIPTSEPSKNPSAEPTIDPTPAPSQSPLACVDYFVDYYSNDGEDDVSSQWPDIQTLNETMIILEKYIANSTNGITFEYEHISCDQTGAEMCYVACLDVASCPSVTIQPASDADGDTKTLQIECEGRRSCDEMMVILNESTVETAQIICNDSSSCKEAQIVIDTSNSMDLSVFCLNTRSCHQLIIDLASNEINGSYDGTFTARIVCHADNACQGLTIVTDDSDEIDLTLNMTRYSEDIAIYHAHWSDVHVNCGLKSDRRYIRYDTDDLPNDYEFLDRARDEYDEKRLPCEGITIHCSSTFGFEQKCTYQYELDLNLTALFSASYIPTCYWLNLNDFYHAECQGTCGNEIIYYSYPQSLELDLTFVGDIDDNNTNLTTSYILCDEYFGTINDTESTMENIDILIDSVLDLMASDPTSLIHAVSESSWTSLRDGFQISCINEDINTIAMTITFTVESAQSDQSVINNMFAPHSMFHNKTVNLLSDFFGVPVYVQIDNSMDILTELGFTLTEVILYSCIIVIVVFRIYRGQRWFRSIIIRNPMVIAIAIGKYDDLNQVTSPQITCELDPLPALDKDVLHVLDLFGNDWMYNVHVDYDHSSRKSTFKLHWTKKEIMDLFQGKSRELANNLHIYDGLLVTVSCHGVNGDIISSDRQRIPKKEIYHLFTFDDDKVKTRSIPRVFLFDCCDGNLNCDDFRRECQGPKPRKPKGSDLAESLLESEGGKTERFKGVGRGKGDTPWKAGEVNPDHKLTVIHAANEDFSAICNKWRGSYLIDEFVKAMRTNVSSWSSWNICRGPRYLREIMDDIQNDLEEKGKQLIVPVYLNKTDRIVFMRPNCGNTSTRTSVPADSECANDGVQHSDDGDGNERDSNHNDKERLYKPPFISVASDSEKSPRNTQANEVNAESIKSVMSPKIELEVVDQQEKPPINDHVDDAKDDQPMSKPQSNQTEANITTIVSSASEQSKSAASTNSETLQEPHALEKNELNESEKYSIEADADGANGENAVEQGVSDRIKTMSKVQRSAMAYDLLHYASNLSNQVDNEDAMVHAINNLVISITGKRKE